MAITIYHNTKCATSRKVLAALRDAGKEPKVIEYLKTPPSRAELVRLAKQMKLAPRDMLRWKEPLAKKLRLDKAKSTDAALLDAMAKNPILIERPIVVTDKKALLARPPDRVQEIL